MRPRTRATIALLNVLLLLAAGLLLGGCSSLGVEPWERAVLAEPGMQIDPDLVVTALDEHIFFSKEASTGGLGTAGGGCGCN